MATMIEINHDLTDMNFFLLNKRALELWELQKQSEDKCNNCDRRDFTSDLTKRTRVTNKEVSEVIPKSLPPARGFWYNDIWMELEEGETVQDAKREIRDALKREHEQEIMNRVEEQEKDEYWRMIDAWKNKGMKYEDQPCYPSDGQLLYTPDECEEFQGQCRHRASCSKFTDDQCDQDSCLEYEPMFSS